MPTLPETLQKQLGRQSGKPPIHLWDPPLSGDIDIVIAANGEWFHEGEIFQRHSLVKLFSSILRREDDGEYYLVTPVEKWRLQVEQCPFVVIDIDVAAAGLDEQCLLAVTNVGEHITINQAHPLIMKHVNQSTDLLPVIELDNNLSAKINRSNFYRLAEFAVETEQGYGVFSDGEWFSLSE